MLAARETKMLSAERMERMIDAPTNDEAAKILEECGYGDLSGLSAKAAGAALEAHIAALFDEVEGMVPEAQLVQLFRLKYDYHNAKALIKAQAMGVECDAILSQRGTIPPQKLHAAFYEEDYRDIPSVLAQAMVSAAAILAHTANPQAADFELDRAYFAQMLDLANGLSDGGFARDYVQLQIDSANLRAAVRTRRMAKDEDFLKTALIPGGTIGTDRVLAAFDSAEALTALYGNTWLGNAAAAVFKEAILRRGIGQHAQFVRAIGDASQHHVTGPQLRQLPQDIPQSGQVVVLPVGGPRQQACLCEIGRHHVRLRRQAGHVAGKILVKARVERSPVSHGRVHEAQGIRPRQHLQRLADILHLSGGGQIAGVDGVQPHLLALPVSGDG